MAKRLTVGGLRTIVREEVVREAHENMKRRGRPGDLRATQEYQDAYKAVNQAILDLEHDDRTSSLDFADYVDVFLDLLKKDLAQSGYDDDSRFPPIENPQRR